MGDAMAMRSVPVCDAAAKIRRPYQAILRPLYRRILSNPIDNAYANAPSTARGILAPADFDREATSSYNTALLAQILLAQLFCSGLSARIGRILLGVCFAAL